jgi:hypothetical protein
MQWHLLIGIIFLCATAGVGIWSYAYRLGLKHGQATRVPFRVIDELLDHKIHCLSQDPALARVELETCLNVEAWEAQSLVQHVCHVPSNRKENPALPVPVRSAGAGDIP